MTTNRAEAPTPDLRIVMTDGVLPHEEFDSQRAIPLIERLKEEKYMINPPVVAPIGASQFVILDGANRCYAFSQLAYPHLLVQVVTYESGFIELSTWRHVVGQWDAAAFLHHLNQLDAISISEGQSARAIAHIFLRDGRVLALHGSVQNTHERNAALRDVVRIYQQKAVLNRTTLTEPADIWPLFPDALAVVVFPDYEPADIVAAAKYKAFLPPGISRHIVQGRALRVNYPLDQLRDTTMRLQEKNDALRLWLQEKLAKREIRYYAEGAYQFDE